jgi:hypothetical protein
MSFALGRVEREREREREKVWPLVTADVKDLLSYVEK